MLYHVDLLEFKPPYKGRNEVYGKPSFSYSDYGKKGGLYFIRQRGELVYIGCSKSCVYKAAYRHFQSWSSAIRERDGKKVSYDADDDFELCIMRIPKNKAHDYERTHIKYYAPRDNEFYKELEIENDDSFSQTEDECPF